MKKTSLKLEIIKQFILSGIKAFIVTFTLFIVFWGIIHLISTPMYNAILQQCNQSNGLMLLNLLGVFLIFCFCFFLIFMKSMDRVTDYIEEINGVVGQVATGDLETQIAVRNHNELGQLADHFNEMTKALKLSKEREKEWDQQKYLLITNLSHDLKTPMMSIMGFVELIGQEKYTSEAQLKHYCDIVLRKTKQLKISIDQLFELSKLNNPGLVIQKQELSIKEMIEQVVIGFTPQFEAAQMAYRLQMPAQPVTIEADGTLMAHVVENLVSNAIKYGFEGKYLDIAVQDRGSMVEIDFINYGKPIPMQEQEQLFGRFYRGEKTLKKQEGSGVGLAIVLSIIQLHKGSIEVESSDKQTCFRVILPKCERSLEKNNG